VREERRQEVALEERAGERKIGCGGALGGFRGSRALEVFPRRIALSLRENLRMNTHIRLRKADEHP